MPQGAEGPVESEYLAEPGVSCCGMMECSCVQASDSILLRSSVGIVMKEGDVGVLERAMTAAISTLAKKAIWDGSYQLVEKFNF